MSWSSISGLTCLLCCVLMSAGRVSPPENLSVTFLDFRGEVNWTSGRGNPPGTKYTVEMQPIGEKWSPLENCTNTESTTCPLIFNLTGNALMESYYIRVRALWRGNSSSWTILDTVQPYGNTILSAPTLKVSVQERDLHVHIHMPQLVLNVLPHLTYNVQVSESNSGDHEEVNFALHVGKLMRSCLRFRGPYVCKSLDLGQRYCVRASAIHKQQQTKPHLSSVKCVKLPDIKSDKPIHIAVITSLLLLVIIALFIPFMYLYMKPRPSDIYTPRSLEAVGGASRTLMAIPTEAPSLSLMCVITPSLSSSITLQERQSSCNWGYECRDGLSCQEQTADLCLLPADEEELGEHLHSPCPSGALDEEELGNRIPEEGTHSTQLCLEKMDWQLDQRLPYLDVPMSSLSLCMGTGEPWEGCGESDSVSKEGEEMDVGTKLLGQPWRNSSENLSGSLETPDEPYPLDKSDPRPTFPTGYEPQAIPTSYEPISSACSPSPTSGQSVLYLKR